MNQNAIMRDMVAQAVKDLTAEELASLNLCAQLDIDPHRRAFDYEKVKHLFTDANGARIHQATKEALQAVVLQRLA